MVDTFTLRSLQSRHPDRDFLSKGPRRWAEVFPESIKKLVLSFRSSWILDSEVARLQRCKLLKSRGVRKHERKWPIILGSELARDPQLVWVVDDASVSPRVKWMVSLLSAEIHV
jgi:hypothetical protein